MGLTWALSRAVRLRGQALAMVDGDVRLDWCTLGDRVARLAAVLAVRGVRHGDRVAILAHNSHRYVEAQFAALWIGAIATPLNTRLALPELQALTADADPAMLLFDSAHAGVAASLLAEHPSMPGIVLGEDAETNCAASEALLRSAAPIADHGVADDDVALLYYTGGTTGRPKGVMLTHANIEANSVNFITESRVSERTVHLHCGPLFHVAAGARVFSMTRVAGTHVMLPRFDADAVLDAIDQHGVTLATFVPTMAKRIVDRLEQGDRALPSLSLVTYGGAPMPQDVLLRLMQRLPHVRFMQSYGQTECAPIATLLGPQDHSLALKDAPRLLSAGRAALLAEVRVVEADHCDCAPRAVGEVLVRGPMVMLGYWRQPEATHQALRGGWLHTGDAGFLDEDGYLYVVDRFKDMIISGGENVYSVEVENALYRHPAVAQCAVFGVPHERWGESVHAVVVPQHGASIEPRELQAHCRNLLAAYKCPLSIDLRQEPLPISGANKILKEPLRAPFWAGRSRGVN